MKIEFKIEDNKPVLFLIDNNGYIVAFNKKDGFFSASRAYMRSLEPVTSHAHLLSAWHLMAQWSKINIKILE